MKQKKRNPQDATLRNIRALQRKVKVLEECVVVLQVESGVCQAEIEGRLLALERRYKGKK